jgi:hypothetical protein
MARKKPTEPELEQGVLDQDFAEKKNPRVHKAGKAYYDQMIERKTAGEEAAAAHDTLLNAMMEEGIEHYVYKDFEVHVNTKKKCKVKVKGAEADKDGDE